MKGRKWQNSTNRLVSVWRERESGTERKGRKEEGRQQSVIIIVAVTIISKYNSMAAVATAVDDSDQAFGGFFSLVYTK